MASVKVKLRPSTVNGREGTLYYQIIHNRVVRQINTEYKLLVSEWDCHSETVILHHLSTEQERNNYLLSPFTHQVGQGETEQNHTHVIPIPTHFVTDDIVVRFRGGRQEQSLTTISANR